MASTTTAHSAANGESPAKRQKVVDSDTQSGPLIGTHNGHFHADEALAVFLLRLLPTYQHSPLVRTRDPGVLATCHTVVDVGGEYDASRHRYDHHQRTFAATFPGRDTKLSSAGLVYKHFGKAIIQQRTGLAPDSDDADVLYHKLYRDLIEAFDANDNGVAAYDPKALLAASIPKRFEDRGFSLAAAVNRFNYDHEHLFAASSAAEPPQQDRTADNTTNTQAREDARFLRASVFVGTQFLLELHDLASAWLPARAAVRAAYAARRTAVHASGRILALAAPQPWADHLYDAERAEAAALETPLEAAQVLYVLFPETAEPAAKWRVRAVGVEGAAFVNRKDLPDRWRGLRDAELADVAGVPGCVFVHASGFIGGNESYEGALEMARRAVEMPAAGMEL